MPTSKDVKAIWQARPSGIVVPDGFVSDVSDSSSHTYLEVKEKAVALERLYQDNQVSISRTSYLSHLIEDAKLLSDSWLTGQAEKHPMTLLFRAGLLDRIANAALPLKDVR